MKNINFIWNYIKPYRYQLLLIILDVAVYAFFMLAAPLLISWTVDNIIQGVPFDHPLMNQLVNTLGGYDFLRNNLWIGSLAIIIAYLFVGAAINRRFLHTGNIAETFAQNVRNTMYDHLQKLPFAYHKSKDSGDLIQRSTSDIETIRRFLANQLSEMLYAIINVTIAISILLSRNVKLTLISIILIPFILLASYIFFTKAKKIFLNCDLAESKMTTVLQEDLNGMRVVKAFHQEQKEIDRFDHYNTEYRNEAFHLSKVLAIFWGSTDFLGQIQILIMIIAGILMALNNEITLGTFFIFLMYESTIVWPLRQLGRILSDFGKLSVAVNRIQEVLNEPCEDLTSGLTPEIKGHIVFDHVSFAYPDGSEHALHDISFEIKEHERLAIMGPTGSGKSTLKHLLSGIYPYTQGTIKNDGVEQTDISLHWLRKHVQIVLQEPFLFSKSIEENIHLSAPSASSQAVIDAAQMASIHDDIMKFDAGYDTAVGEKGVTLSGGQKQRVAIARSLLAHSPILIFDDSLSALDMKTDQQIQQALKEIEDPMTMLMITHRVSSASTADHILVLENGHITQYGTHEELIVQEGLYRRIYEIQKEGSERNGTTDGRERV